MQNTKADLLSRDSSLFHSQPRGDTATPNSTLLLLWLLYKEWPVYCRYCAN